MIWKSNKSSPIYAPCEITFSKLFVKIYDESCITFLIFTNFEFFCDQKRKNQMKAK